QRSSVVNCCSLADMENMAFQVFKQYLAAEGCLQRSRLVSKYCAYKNKSCFCQ
ncbi:hypothetical protein NDU88_008216, partial [Pleurodeles waltl]